MRSWIPLVFLSAAALAQGEDTRFAPKETKRSERVKDPLTGREFDLPIIEPTTEVLRRDRLLRPVVSGEHPRLRQIWVSPETGFASYPDRNLWKEITESKDDAGKAKLKAALAKFPRRYASAETIPALHRYALAWITYETLGRLDGAMRYRLALDALHCALDEGNAAAAKKYRALLKPVVEKRCDDESLGEKELITASYLLGELARLDGDAATAQRRFDECLQRIGRWKEARDLREPARLGLCEILWKEKGAEELLAIARGDDRNDARVATILLVDRGAGAALAALLGDADETLRLEVANRALERPQASLVPALEPLLAADAPVRDAAAFALGSLGTKEAVLALAKALPGEADELRAAALARARTPDAAAALARMTREGASFDLALLPSVGGAEIAAAMVERVKTVESYNRGKAFRAAAGLAPAIVAPLEAALAAEKEPAALGNLLRLAARLDRKSLRAAAAPHLASDEEEVRRAAALVLAREGKGRDLLVAALGTGDAAAAMEALGWFGPSPAIAEAISPKVRAESPTLFLAALRAAGRAKDASRADAMEALLDDPDPIVAAHAAHGLALLGRRERILPRLESGHYLVVSGIARGLGESGDAAAVPVLIRAFGADDGAWLGGSPGVSGDYGTPRREIADALRRIGGKQAEAFLEKEAPVIK